MIKLNFNQLYYFFVVASEGSIKAATKKLHVTQPTISNQIKQLEEFLGFQLFKRKHRKLELNEHGIELLGKAEKIFLMADEMVRTSTGKLAQTRQKIRIGALPSLPNSFIHDLTFKLWKDPTNAVSIIHADLVTMIRMLDEDKLDLILSDEPYNKSKRRYKSYNLGSQRIVAVANQKFSSLKKHFPKSLDGTPYVSYSKQSRIQDDLEYYFKIENIHPDCIGEVDDVTLMRVGAEKGLGFAIMPYIAAKESLKRKELVLLGELENIKCNGWVITTTFGSQNIAIRKAISYYMHKKSKAN